MPPSGVFIINVVVGRVLLYTILALLDMNVCVVAVMCCMIMCVSYVCLVMVDYVNT